MAENIIGSASISILDINDITLGQRPANPEEGTVYLDETTDPPRLKIYHNGQWENLSLRFSDLDSDLAETIESILSSIGNIADDGILDLSERKDVAMEISQIIGEVPSRVNGNVYPNSLPSYENLDSSGVGTFASIRETARDSELQDSDEYIILQQMYTALNSYLSGLNPRPWDVTQANRERLTEVTNPDLFRERFLNYFMAELALSVKTEKRAKELAKEYTDSITDGSSVQDKDTVTGETPYSSVSDNGIVHVNVEGTTFQQTSSQGKNMAPTQGMYWEDGHYGTDGFKYPYGGRIRVPHLIKVEPTTQYFFRTADSNFSFVIRAYDSNGNFVANLGTVTNVNGNTHTMGTSVHYIGVTIFNADEGISGNTIRTRLDNGFLLPFICLGSESNRTFEEFIPNSPSPDYPSELQSLNNFDIVSSKGKRNMLLNTTDEWQTINHNIWYAGLRTLLFEDYDLKAGDVVTFGFYTKTNAIGVSARLRWQQGSNTTSNNYSDIIINPNSEGRTWVTGTVPSNADRLVLASTNDVSGTNFQTEYKELMLVRGEVATAYTQAPEDIDYDDYTSTIYKTNVTLSEPLRKVGETADKLFLDTDNLWKVERNIGEADMSPLNWYAQQEHNYYYRFTLASGNNLGARLSSGALTGNNDVPIMSNLLSYGVASQGIFITTHTSNGMQFSIEKYRISSFSRDSVQSYLATVNGKVMYRLITPSIEILPEQDQAKLNNIRSYKGTNYVYTVDPYGLKPSLQVTFKSEGWYVRELTEQRLSDTITQDDLEEAEQDLISTFSAGTENLGDLLRSEVTEMITDLDGNLQQLVNSTVDQTASSWELTFDEVTRKLDDHGQSLDEFDVYKGWYHVRSEQVNGVTRTFLELGDSNSTTKIRIYGNRISFVSGNEEVAYFSDQTLHINQGVFVERLMVGQHQLETDANGVTSFNWVPPEE